MTETSSNYNSEDELSSSPLPLLPVTCLRSLRAVLCQAAAAEFPLPLACLCINASGRAPETKGRLLKSTKLRVGRKAEGSSIAACGSCNPSLLFAQSIFTVVGGELSPKVIISARSYLFAVVHPLTQVIGLSESHGVTFT